MISIVNTVIMLWSLAIPPGGEALPSIDSQVVFLYYKDVDTAAVFYEKTLGLKKTFDEGWVKIYQVSSTSYVGLVDGDRGYHKAAAGKPVMLSIVTGEVDAWYEHMTKASGVKVLSKIKDAGNSPTRSFLVADPEGYTVEFFQWR